MVWVRVHTRPTRYGGVYIILYGYVRAVVLLIVRIECQRSLARCAYVYGATVCVVGCVHAGVLGLGWVRA